MKSHFGEGGLLYICCIFSERLLLRTPLDGYFWILLRSYCYVPSSIPQHSLIKRQSCHHIETSQLICPANQLTGFYMTTTLVFNELISVKERSNVDLVITIFQEGDFLCYNQRIGKRYRIWDTGTYINAWLSWEKTNYGIIVPRDIVMNILKEIDPKETHMRKARRLRRRKCVFEGPNSCGNADGYDKLKPYGFPIHGCIGG